MTPADARASGRWLRAAGRAMAGMTLLAASALSPRAAAAEGAFPADFVSLSAVDPTIAQDIRYAGPFNFTGAPVPGYGAAECILRRPAAEALARAQEALRASGLSLKVLDCYRPHKATLAFRAWAQGAGEGDLKAEFHPGIAKGELFKRGFIASASTHSAGLAVDLTIVRPEDEPKVTRRKGGGACDGPFDLRPFESSLDMGTTFDCFSGQSATASAAIAPEAKKNRRLLLDAMTKAGFVNYAKEWWHFSLPARGTGGDRRMDFDIGPREGK